MAKIYFFAGFEGICLITVKNELGELVNMRIPYILASIEQRNIFVSK